MFATYLIVTLLAVAANTFSACDFVRYEKVSVAMDNAGVSQSWMTPLGILKAAGALGFLVGIVIPPVGVAAAAGLVAFFIGAIFVHLRARDYSFGLAGAFLALAVGALALQLILPG